MFPGTCRGFGSVFPVPDSGRNRLLPEQLWDEFAVKGDPAGHLESLLNGLPSLRLSRRGV